MSKPNRPYASEWIGLAPLWAALLVVALSCAHAPARHATPAPEPREEAYDETAMLVTFVLLSGVLIGVAVSHDGEDE